MSQCIAKATPSDTMPCVRSLRGIGKFPGATLFCNMILNYKYIMTSSVKRKEFNLSNCVYNVM